MSNVLRGLIFSGLALVTPGFMWYWREAGAKASVFRSGLVCLREPSKAGEARVFWREVGPPRLRMLVSVGLASFAMTGWASTEVLIVFSLRGLLCLP